MNRLKSPVGLLILTLACGWTANLALADTTIEAAADTTGPGTSTVILPVLGYTPDTGVLLGASVLRFFQLDEPGPNTQSSVFSPVVIYTAKKQTMVFLGSDLYWDNGRNHVSFVPRYMKFPDQFYGIGRDSDKYAEEDYTPEVFGLELLGEREVYRELRVGLDVVLTRHRVKKMQDDGQLASGQVLGTETGTISAPGVTLAWDSRDHPWSAHRGLWLQTGVRFARSTFGSDYRYTEYRADLRGYLPLNDTWSLAAQILGASLDGDVPFHTLPTLGGQDGLRGYKQGRYMDKTRLLVRTEVRTGEIWGKLGAVAFAGIGDVAPKTSDLTLRANLWSAGCGLRYTVNDDEQVKIRMDFGFGNDDSGFYLSIGEAF
jgi:outer membrane protein assembly factor BamA